MIYEDVMTDAPMPNALISTNTSQELTAPNSTPSNTTTSPNNSFNNTFTNNSFHNNTISNRINFSTVLPPRPKSTLPVAPQSPSSLTTLCIQTICKRILKAIILLYYFGFYSFDQCLDFNKIHALQSGLLPEELIHRVIACLISDEMSVYIKQLDASVSHLLILTLLSCHFIKFLLFWQILGKLLDSSLGFLDFENSTSLYPSSCMVIASRCHNLRRLNLTNCISIQ